MKIIDYIVNWSRGSSIWLLQACTGCCSLEIAAANTTPFDFERFGSLPAANPRQADIMVITGLMAKKAAKRVKVLYEQMPDPKFVIAVGSCAYEGGPYYDSYSVVKRPYKELGFPVDVFVPGCPPRPEAFLQGLMMLRDKIIAGKYKHYIDDVENEKPEIIKISERELRD